MTGFFDTLSPAPKKSAKVAEHSNARVLAHPSSSVPAAHLEASLFRDDFWVMMMSEEQSVPLEPPGAGVPLGDAAWQTS